MNKEEIKVIVENSPSKEMAAQKIKELCDFLSNPSFPVGRAKAS
jgi:hypothetical protein